MATKTKPSPGLAEAAIFIYPENYIAQKNHHPYGVIFLFAGLLALRFEMIEALKSCSGSPDPDGRRRIHYIRGSLDASGDLLRRLLFISRFIIYHGERNII